MSMDGSTPTGAPFSLHVLKQASNYFKDKIRTARLALTDVTLAEQLTEDVTNGSPWAPDAMTMHRISRAAFEIDDFWRIVEILHKRLEKFELKHWRLAYKALILLEHLLIHGPESVSEEFQEDRDVILELGEFQYVDEKGFNWGVAVSNKSQRVLKLLEKGPLLREERDRARKISRGIQGFGSFNLSWSSSDNCTAESSQTYGRSHSHYENYGTRVSTVPDNKDENLNSDVKLDPVTAESEEDRILKEGNISPRTHQLDESKPLLLQEEEKKANFLEEDHPFCKFELDSKDSLLLLSRS